jgi:small GTP-binding protein
METFFDNKIIKIIIIGNSGSGKTSFCNRWTKGSFSDKYKATILTDFSEKIHKYNGKEYKISLWDLAGQDRNIHTTKILTKNALCCLVFCDITNMKSRNDTLKWKASVEENSFFLNTKNKIPCFLIENKIDLVDEDTKKDISELSEFSQINNYSGFYRTSAKTGENVDFIMDSIIAYIINKLEEYTKEGNTIEHRKSLFELKSEKTNENKDKEAKNNNDCC